MTLQERLIQTPLPLNTESFCRLMDLGRYYVDKTLLIKSLIDSGSDMFLFTRPRRFGKTLNMSMIQTFFENPSDGHDTSHYFKNLKIWQCGEKYTSEQGKRPVIALSFKDIKCGNYDDALNEIRKVIALEYKRHNELYDSNMLDDTEKGIYRGIANQTAPDKDWTTSIAYLSFLIEKHHKIKPVLLIDEYDVPLQESWYAKERYYDKMIRFVRNLLSSALKTNFSIYKGILTGVTRVSKESIFSGLNNLYVNTVFDEDFSEYFGFTQEEINEMFHFYGIENKLEEAKNWYDGYIFGEQNIYNPWSILCYLDKKCKAAPYWINVSSNDLAKDAIKRLDEYDRRGLVSIVSG